jgi:hypothetical protein
MVLYVFSAGSSIPFTFESMKHAFIYLCAKFYAPRNVYIVYNKES